MPNRTLFADRVEERLRDTRTAGLPVILFLDLDDFKVVNDTLGHEAGDRLLSSVAERITRSLRPDDLAARMGGDEFAVLLAPDTTIGDAVTVAHRLLDELGSPFLIAGTEVDRRVPAWASHAAPIRRSRRSSCSGTRTSRCTPPSRRESAGSRCSSRPSTRRSSPGMR